MKHRSLLVLFIGLMAALSMAVVADVVWAATNSVGKELPMDAAPPEKQVFYKLSGPATTLDWFISVYNRPGQVNDLFSVPLVQLNKNFEILPAAATSWEASADGLTWTFHLDRNLVWTDGNAVTADDYVFSFQLGADPKHAWDFAWFYSPIKNWDKAVKGEVPVSQIGVRKGRDDYTLLVTTENPAPYLPSMMLYSTPLSKRAYDRYGEFYNNRPETSVSSGPFILQEWTKDKQIVLVANKKYGGKVKPYLEKMVVIFGDPKNEFTSYQANEVDIAETFSPADIELISRDPDLNTQYHQGFGDFRTHYLGFDTYRPPFNNLKVRQAISHVIDRDSLIKNVVKRQGMAAYSFLMPGFPDSNVEGLKGIQNFDPALGKRLLAEAGYPDGRGFPKIELWLRNESSLGQAIGNAMAAMIKQHLGIEVTVTNKEGKLFMDTLNAHNLQFYMVSYGMDYLDASNMLGIWVSTGRHAWKNDRFDKLVDDAASLVGDMAKRSAMFKEAEKILVEDVAGVFLWHVTPGTMWKPYVKGSELEADKNGMVAWHWPGIEGIGQLHLTTYISRDVDRYRRK